MGLSACAALQPALTSQIESLPGAVSVPYSVSPSGLIVVDVSVNDRPPAPFIIDTGATVSVIFDDYINPADINHEKRSVFVRGLVSAGERPIIENLNLRIGAKTFTPERVIVLETPKRTQDSIGLIGSDIMAGYVTVFNTETGMASFVPRANVSAHTFTGWRRISIQSKVDKDTDARLYFAYISDGRGKIPVMIDTGSNLNFINWQLAGLDENIRRLERDLRNEGVLHGALASTAVTTKAVFTDLQLGRQYWPEIDVTVMKLDPLSSVAPVDEPMMIAGAGLFTPWTIALDLDGHTLYIRPGPDDPIRKAGTGITYR